MPMGGVPNQQNLLDPRETSQLNNFFDDPDTANMQPHDFGLHWPVDAKVEDPDIEHDTPGLDQKNRTVSDPAVTLAGSQAGGYIHSNSHEQQQSHMTTPVHSTISNYSNFSTDVNSTAEEQNAASGLFQLAAHGRHQESHAQQPPIDQLPIIGGSWGRINVPLNHNNQYMHPQFQQGMGNPYGTSGQLGQNQNGEQNYQQYHQGGGGEWNGQAVNMRMANTNMSHATHQTLPGNPQFFYDAAHMQGMQLAHGQGPGSHLRFGTDPSFSNSHYPVPQGWNEVQAAKGGNLNEVPMFAGVISPTQKHMTGTGSGSRGYTNGNLTSSNTYGNMNPPNGLGGLPTTNGFSNHNNTYNHSHPDRQMALPTTEDDNSEENSPNRGQKPRKRIRRDENNDDDDDGEFTPTGQGQRSNGKRMIKQETNGVGSPIATTPSKGTTNNKRRKSSNAIPYPDSDSEEDASGSDDGEPSSSRKRRSRKSQSRQNLSLEDKRKNHIQSEKMRRDLIKLQYESLDEMVPGLKNGKSGLSRADVLEEICEYIRALELGNEQVKKMLVEHQTQSGQAGSSGGAGG